MDSLRITSHPVLAVKTDNKEVAFVFNEKTYKGRQGDTIASALLANGIRTLRLHEESGSPKGIYCNIGHCCECRVQVNEFSSQRACLTPIQEGMAIKSGRQLPIPFKDGDQQ